MDYMFVNNTTIQTYDGQSYANLSTVSVFSNTSNNSLNFIVNPANAVVSSDNLNINGNVSFSTGNVVVTGNSLMVGTSSKTSNGYTWLPNGLLYQWGTVASNTTVGNITFPVPFPTGLFSITATTNTPNSAVIYTYASFVIASNTSTANVRTGNTTSRNVTWMALGY